MSLCGSSLGNWLVLQSRSLCPVLLFPRDVGTSLGAGFSGLLLFMLRVYYFYFLLLFYFITLFPFIEILEKKGGESHVSSTTPVSATHLHLLSQNAPLAAVLGSYHSAWQLSRRKEGLRTPDR